MKMNENIVLKQKNLYKEKYKWDRFFDFYYL